MKILYYDTETTGLPNRNRAMDYPTQPYLTQVGFLLEGDDGEVMDSCDTLIKPYGDRWAISPQAMAITGITREKCEEGGVDVAGVMDHFVDCAFDADLLVCHNVAFDSLIMQMQAKRLAPDMQHTKAIFEGAPHVCTMLAAMPICKIPPKDGRKNGYKWPKLEEAIMHFFGEKLDGAHDAMIDITATRRLFRHLANIGGLDIPFAKIGMKVPKYG